MQVLLWDAGIKGLNFKHQAQHETRSLTLIRQPEYFRVLR